MARQRQDSVHSDTDLDIGSLGVLVGRGRMGSVGILPSFTSLRRSEGRIWRRGK